MSQSLVIIVSIVGVLILAVIAVLLMGRRSATTGALSRETKASDKSEVKTPAMVGASAEATEGAQLPAIPESEVPATVGAKLPTKFVPVDEEELGITRRQVMNRGILTLIGVGALAPFGLALLGFLWPTKKGGFGGTVDLDVSAADALQYVADQKKPFYAPSARAYINPYPAAAIPAAKKVPQYKPPLIAGMESLGIVVLYQKCPHLGCKVPWCDSSQWFECPCHGSKYNRVGQKKGGPAPRGMSLFATPTKDKAAKLSIDTSVIYDGPPPGTDTTGQGAEGPPCV